MIHRKWSQETIEASGKRITVISEMVALVFPAGKEVHGGGLKLPRYVVVLDHEARAFGMDGLPVTLETVRQACPEYRDAPPEDKKV